MGLKSKNSSPGGNVEAWLNANFLGNALPPFSFVYDGKHSSDFIRNWRFSKEKINEDESKVEWIFLFFCSGQ